MVAAREIGLDSSSVLAVDVSTEAFNRPGGWDGERVREVALQRHELPLLAAELDAMERDCATEFATGYIAEGPDKLRRLHQYFAALLGEGDFDPPDCNAPWVSAVIETDGTVRPCFVQPPLGNIREAESLDAIINSPEAAAWRRGLYTHRNAICRQWMGSLTLRRA